MASYHPALGQRLSLRDPELAFDLALDDARGKNDFARSLYRNRANPYFIVFLQTPFISAGLFMLSF